MEKVFETAKDVVLESVYDDVVDEFDVGFPRFLPFFASHRICEEEEKRMSLYSRDQGEMFWK